MPEYSLSGQLCFTTQDPKMVAKLTSEGFPVVGTRVETSVPFQAYGREALTVGQAKEIFRQRISALKDGEHMGITGVYTPDWSRGDLLHGYERQLAHYTPAEIANPGIIMEGFGLTCLLTPGPIAWQGSGTGSSVGHWDCERLCKPTPTST